MNHKNDFKAFSINNNANVVSQERYEESQSLKTGFPPDNITVHLLNKVLRQSSTIASVVSNFIATYSGSDVLDDGDIVKLAAQLNGALEQKIATEVPNASLIQKGVVQLTEVVGNGNTLAATQKLVSDVNNNANSRLSKNQNGADVPNKNEFVKNLGLVNTVNLAKSAVPNSRKINGKSLSNDINLSAEDVKAQPAGNYVVRGEIYTKSESDGRYQPRGNYQPAGNYAVRGESYTKSESDGKYQLKGRQLLGVNQSWVNVTSSRALNTVYTNSTGSPIAVIIWSNSRAIAFKIGNVFVDSYSGLDNCTFIVPVGATYELVEGRLGTWIELR